MRRQPATPSSAVPQTGGGGRAPVVNVVNESPWPGSTTVKKVGSDQLFCRWRVKAAVVAEVRTAKLICQPHLLRMAHQSDASA